MEIDSEGIGITEISNITGQWEMRLNQASMYTIYVLNGEGKTEGGSLSPNDFLVVKDENELRIDFSTEAKLFIIKSPAEVSYRTYAEGQTL